MTDSKARQTASARARAAVKARRWAIKKEGGAARRGQRLLLGGLMAGSVLTGGLLSLALAPDDGAIVVAEPSTRVSIHIPGAQQGTAEGEPAANRTGNAEPVLLPAAGPEPRSVQVAALERLPPPEELGRMAYEEPFDPGARARPLTIQEIEAAIGRSLVVPVPDLEAPVEIPAWRRNVVPVARFDGRPMIAIVIDDLGLNRPNARRAVALPPPLTLAFMSYAPGVQDLTSAARALGHELLVHVPMEPSSEVYDPGPNALKLAQDSDEVMRRLDWALSRFEGYVGINNHMGSKFTASPLGMAGVMAELKARGLLFLDSRTSGASIGADLAERMGVARAARDVFIDNRPDDPEAIRAQLAKLEQIARKHGKAVGIGHPHDATLTVLSDWLTEVRERGFALVPISAIAVREFETAEGGESQTR